MIASAGNRSQDFIGIPSSPQARIDGCPVKTSGVGRIGYTQTLSGMGDVDVVTPISVLDANCLPRAIPWGVRPIVVFSLNAVPRRSRSHISKKGGEVIPLWADLDATAPVALKCGVRWGVAARSHPHPNLQFSRDAPIGRMTMLRLCRQHRGEPQAATASLAPVAQFLRGCNGQTTAVASALPEHQARAINAPAHRQLAETHPM